MVEKRICTLYSGSGGNAIFFEAKGVKLIFDAGKNARALCRALSTIGESIENIDAIFITHEHTDHVSALEVISKKHALPIHISDRCAKKFDKTPEAFIHRNLVRHDTEFETEVGTLRIKSFKTPHDSLDSVGYRVDIPCDSGFVSVGIATDIGYVTRGICDALLGCDAIVLESNHDEGMLMDGSYPYELKMRILSRKGHLSNRAAAEFGAYLASEGTRSFILAHLSEENNRPEIAYDEFVSAIGDSSVHVAVAHPEEPTEMIFA